MNLNSYFLYTIFCFIMYVLFQYLCIWLVIKFFRKLTSVFSLKKVNKQFKENVVINTVKPGNKYKRIYKDVSNKELKEFNVVDINDLKDFFYGIFFEFETAYNSLDYNKMKILSTSQLFNNYYTGIDLNLKAGKKRIIENIERKNVVVYEFFSSMLKQTASVMIEISYLNYMRDKKGNVILGSSTDKITEKFEVEFRKEFREEFKEKEITICPTCGASVVGNKCVYCRNIIKENEFKISSIRKIIEE